ncbi:hypothetical protein MYAM1_003463 [Malassezia yamatoensis]|uniref:triacylglycerol lipase n=1 Tax=Malassezia yamatoensis TaxID=253288 RepID=A0AAJ5YUX0_9BASI|nr:hypothetical protein MYAM1_003463 [Malassezia yamatoensis]
MLIPFFFALLSFIGCASALSHPVERRTTVLSPNNDPFYDPPSGWESASPGDVLRSRKVKLAFLQIEEYKYKAAYQLLYRTTGAYEHNASTTVTTVIIPYNAVKNKLVNYLVYTDANGAQCAPSYAMQLGAAVGTELGLTYQQLLMNTFLDQGWILTVADYQGPTRGFAAGRMEGRMALDATRATLNFERAGLSKNSEVVTYGYSGGAIASGWAAAQQSSYAPKINAIGYGMGGTPANLSGTVENLNSNLFAGFAVTGVTGLLYTYPKLLAWAQNRITDKGRQAIEFARSNCLVNVLLEFPFIKFLSDTYVENGAKLLYDPVVRSIVGDIVLGLKKSETPVAPVYMFHGLHDEVIPYGDAIKAARNWTNHGADVYFQEYTDVASEHLVTELTGIPNLLFFVRDRFAGKPFPKGFRHTTTDSGLDGIDAKAQGIASLVSSIEDIIGKEVGPADSILKTRIAANAH